MHHCPLVTAVEKEKDILRRRQQQIQLFRFTYAGSKLSGEGDKYYNHYLLVAVADRKMSGQGDNH